MTIDRTQFPELDKLLWDRKTRFLQAEDAMATYERRWGFVDRDNLSVDEKKLINHLVQTTGGYIPVAI